MANAAAVPGMGWTLTYGERRREGFGALGRGSPFDKLRVNGWAGTQDVNDWTSAQGERVGRRSGCEIAADVGGMSEVRVWGTPHTPALSLRRSGFGNASRRCLRLVGYRKVSRRGGGRIRS